MGRKGGEAFIFLNTLIFRNFERIIYLHICCDQQYPMWNIYCLLKINAHYTIIKLVLGLGCKLTSESSIDIVSVKILSKSYSFSVVNIRKKCNLKI